MIVDGTQAAQCAVRDIWAVFLGNVVMLFRHSSGVPAELPQRRVKPRKCAQRDRDILRLSSRCDFSAPGGIEIPCQACLRLTSADSAPISAISGDLRCPSCGAFGCCPRLICARHSFAIARAVRVEIWSVSPIDPRIDDRRLPPFLRSPCTVNVRLRFPTTTKKVFKSEARARYQPSSGAGN
jgi:hypothetical protein